MADIVLAREKDLEDLKQYIKELKEYVHHKQDCNLMQWGHDIDIGCTCGHDKLINKQG